jgi:hypothetical protein
MTGWQINIAHDQGFDQLAYLTTCSVARYVGHDRGIFVNGQIDNSHWWQSARLWCRDKYGVQLNQGNDPLRMQLPADYLLLDHLSQMPEDIPDLSDDSFVSDPQEPSGPVVKIRTEQGQRSRQQLTPHTVWEYDSTFHRLARAYFDRPSLDFTAIMPVHLDSHDRLENVLEITRYMHHRLCVDKISLVEYDSQPKVLPFVADRPYIRYFFCQQDGRLWNKCRLINTALEWADTQAIAVWDTDAIISLGQLRLALKAVTEGEMCAAIPFESMYHVDRRYLLDVRSGRLNHIQAIEHPLFTIERGGGQACFVANTHKFRHARGANRLFWGWGGEDDEMLLRMHKLFGKVAKVGGPLIHIAHERTEQSFPDESYGGLNEGERQRVLDMTVEELQQYMGVSSLPGRYAGLDEPDAVDEQLAQSIQRMKESGQLQPGRPGY